MKSGALFAGTGGLDLAVEEVFGATPAWVSEIEPGPSKILATRFPGVPNLGDITKVDWAAVEPVELISGGSPCQDLSHAGSRAGMNAGTRSGLWASMCDAIAIIRPKFVVWENVRGALSASATAGDVETCDLCVGDAGDVHLRALGRVLGDLAELGYDAAWHGLRAADIGAPHGRWRVFVLAWAAADTDSATGRERGFPAAGEAEGGRARAHAGRSDRAPVALLPTPTQRGTDANTSTREQAGPNLHNAVTLLPTPEATNNENRQSLDRYGPNLGMALSLLPTPAVNDMGAGKTVEDWDAWTARMKAAHGNGNGHGKSLSIETQRLAVATDFGIYAAAVGRWEAVLGRPAPAPTEPTGRDGAHRLSPRFVEWLMGLDDGWVTDVGLTRNEQLKALGNGVVPQQAAAALRHLLTIRAMALTTQEIAA